MARGSTNGMGRRGGGRSPDREIVINSGQRKTMGTSAYQMRPDAPSASEFRAGMVSHKEGVDKSDAPVGRTSKRRSAGLARTSLGARYRITPNTNAVVKPDPRTLGSTKVVPPVMGRSSFWAGGRD